MIAGNDFQIFIKPVGAGCNLNCHYCYYLSKADLYAPQKMVLMEDAVLEGIIKQQIGYSTSEVISFSWHGGEPMMAGIDFYRRAVEFQQKYKPPGRIVVNGIQTNGTLIDEEWAVFMKENNFSVGVSIDGPGVYHDRFRKSKKGADTFSRVMRGWALLEKYQIPGQALCVLSRVNENDPKGVYSFLKSIGAEYISFIPLVVDTQGRINDELSIRADKFGDFLITVFEEWKSNDIGRIKVQIFEESLRLAAGLGHSQCIFREECGGVPVIESNGDIYSCDHFVNSGHLIGKIGTTSLSDALEGRDQSLFGSNKKSTLPQYCRDCGVLDMCNGECPRYRIISTPDGEPGLNYLCEGYRKFFNHCSPFVKLVAELQRRNL